MIDVHAHLCDERLLPLADTIVSEMEGDGLSAVIDSGFCPSSSLTALSNAKKYDRVFCTVGVHPEEYEKASEDVFGEFEKLYNAEKKIVAIGEIGLDYHYPELDKTKEREIFERQLELAGALNASVVLHIRDALGDAYDVLNNCKSYLKGGVLLHCYSGSKDMVRQFERFDCYYSFGGAVTFKNATDKPDVIRAVPPERLLTETDCPYMTPVPFRGQTNFPKYVRLSLIKIAEILGKTFEEVDCMTTENAKRLFPRLY